MWKFVSITVKRSKDVLYIYILIYSASAVCNNQTNPLDKNLHSMHLCFLLYHITYAPMQGQTTRFCIITPERHCRCAISFTLCMDFFLFKKYINIYSVYFCIFMFYSKTKFDQAVTVEYRHFIIIIKCTY